MQSEFSVFECIVGIQADQLSLKYNDSELDYAKQTNTGRQQDNGRDLK